eukprot:c6713_g2_i1.p1 GENE.c6713_g2_i1~~c6713_g2_i1.p1  ORF type:complete len:391 (+),score=85.52 c6713_g2_i1:122-1174(+)
MIPNFEKWLQNTTPTQASSIPSSLRLGSFRGELCQGNTVFPFVDFGLVLVNNYVIAKGFVQDVEFVMNGQYGLCTDDDMIRAAINMDLFSLPEENIAQTPKTPSSASTATTTHLTPISRVELRCEITPDTIDHNNINHGHGISGVWYRNDDNTEIIQGSIALWPTPESERTGGLLSFVFTTPLCGIEHTGALPHWHGSGAEIRRVQEPASSLGLRPGDVIRFANETPIRPHLKSLEVSSTLKQSIRPLHMIVWREVSNVTLKLIAIGSLEIVDEDFGTIYEALQQQQQQQNGSQQISSVDSTAIKESFANLETITTDLRAGILEEIQKKRQSLAIARKNSAIRRSSFVQS